ncbi:hypothetical protein AGABI1DRAFT_111719, partial [Agaricus bisporus var. burnettii JB137-S8]
MSQSSKTRVAIIGAGTGGLSLAIKLKQQLGYDNFTIFEKGHDVGGTWRDNTYPGCSSDVHMVWFSLSTDSHDWPHSHGYSPDIQAYWVGLTRKYDLYPRIRLHTKVSFATWDDNAKLYHIDLENVLTGEKDTFDAEVVVSAIGILEVPRYPSIPGLESFKGEMWHSARWNHEADLRNKKVAVIGTGASATQLVPCITEDPTVQVTEFCRTPNWLLPPVRVKYSKFHRWVFRNIPLVQRFSRFLTFCQSDLLYLMVFAGYPILRRIFRKVSENYIKSNAPAEYCDQLIPTFPIGCKRVIFDTGFLDALHRPNLSLIGDGIDKFVADGIVTKKGDKLPFDVIIFATGFAADKFPLDLRGTSGTIQEYFDEKDGPQSYLGTSYPDFPNFYTILGPNTGTGHTSVIFTNECQADYIIQLITPIIQRKVVTVEAKPEATDTYNEKIQKRLSASVFTGCHSWYRVGGTGKITNIFPGPTILFWLWLRKVNWDDYTGLGLEGWIERRRISRRKKILTLALAVILIGSGACFMFRIPGISKYLPRWKLGY